MSNFESEWERTSGADFRTAERTSIPKMATPPSTAIPATLPPAASKRLGISREAIRRSIRGSMRASIRGALRNSMKRRSHLFIESLKPAYSDSECGTGTKQLASPDFGLHKRASPTSDIEVMTSTTKSKRASPEESQSQQKAALERIASEAEETQQSTKQSSQQSSSSTQQQPPPVRKRPSFLFPFPMRAKCRSRAASSQSSAASDQMSVASGGTTGGGSVLGFGAGMGASTSFVSLKSLPRFLMGHGGRGVPSPSSLALAAEQKARQRMKLIVIRLKKFARERKAAKTLTVHWRSINIDFAFALQL